MKLRFAGQELEIRHVGPAHTDGDSIVLFPDAKAVHVGDLLFNGMFPFVDHDSGGSVAGMIAALREVRVALPADWKVIPGHGALAGAAEIDASLRMLEATLEVVHARAQQGMNKQAIVAAGLPAEWASWSWQFVTTERWLETLARECGVTG